MKFNPTFLEILVFLLACLIIFNWTKRVMPQEMMDK